MFLYLSRRECGQLWAMTRRPTPETLSSLDSALESTAAIGAPCSEEQTWSPVHHASPLRHKTTSAAATGKVWLASVFGQSHVTRVACWYVAELWHAIHSRVACWCVAWQWQATHTSGMLLVCSWAVACNTNSMHAGVLLSSGKQHTWVACCWYVAEQWHVLLVACMLVCCSAVACHSY